MARSRQPQQPQMDIDAKNRANLKQPQQQQQNQQLPGKVTYFKVRFIVIYVIRFHNIAVIQPSFTWSKWNLYLK